MKRVIISAVLVACLLGMQACISCPPDWDGPTCRINQAIAIGGLVDQGAQALLVAIPILPPPIVAAIAAYHIAYPLAVDVAQKALAEYETTHSGLWAAALAGLTDLYTAFDKLITSFGQPSLVTAAKAEVKAKGATQVMQELRLKGTLK
jgi:hypothetical protein